jgi:hypothetical protein
LQSLIETSPSPGANPTTVSYNASAIKNLQRHD